MRTRRSTIDDLRLAIDCLPVETRVAMLEGIRSDPIIVGAYANRDGICPMLAAHRHGGRTSAIAFAHAWDRFAISRSGIRRRLAPRAASERELRVLGSHLEASLLEEAVPAAELGKAIAQHRALAAGRPERDAAPERPGDRDRSAELRHRPGWGWLRPARSYDEFVGRLRAAQGAPEPAPGADQPRERALQTSSR